MEFVAREGREQGRSLLVVETELGRALEAGRSAMGDRKEGARLWRWSLRELRASVLGGSGAGGTGEECHGEKKRELGLEMESAGTGEERLGVRREDARQPWRTEKRRAELWPGEIQAGPGAQRA